MFDDAERRAMLVNVVDVPPLCNFILPAIVRTGPLAVAISTAGASPALAKRMKREISELFGEAYADLAVMLNDVRGWAKATLPTYQDRKVFFESIVNGDPDPIALLRAGDESARARPDRRRPAGPRAGCGALTRAPAAAMSELTHLDAAGQASMVDVGDKPATRARARWRARPCASRQRPPALVARRRRAQGRCHRRRADRRHPGGQAHVRADPALPSAGALLRRRRGRRRRRARGRSCSPPRPATTGPTGVEMEALTAAAVAALTVYDMVKGVERGAEIAAVQLLEKSGGRSGEWRRPADSEPDQA